MTIEDALAALLLFLMFIFGRGEGMGRRYMLSAFKYDEDSGRTVPLHVYKTEDLGTHAEHTARLMLETNPEAMLIEAYDTRTKQITRYRRH